MTGGSIASVGPGLLSLPPSLELGGRHMSPGDDRELQVAESRGGPLAGGSVPVVSHFRRYLLLYVAGAVGGLFLILLPTVGGGGRPLTRAAAAGPAPAQVATAAGGAGAPGGGAAVAAAVAPSQAGAGGGAAAGSVPAASAPAAGGEASGGPVGTVRTGTGTTVGGFACSAGVGQLPWATYAAPCVARFTGTNGGATAPGVTATTIRIAVRVASDSQGANALEEEAAAEAAGGVNDQQNWQYIQTLTDYFNRTFELYGRKVVFVPYNGQGNGTNEALGEGQEAACADADEAATSVHAFGLGDYNGFLVASEPLTDCGARYHLYVPEGAWYFPESFYQQWDPYVWSIVTNCTTVAQGLADYVAKQLYPYPTRWAGDDGLLSLQGKPRTFAIYVPNNAGYQSCTNYFRSLGVQKYHEASNRYEQYNYALNISTFPEDAQNAMVKFAADHDTTIVMACDPISMIFLTQDGQKENYYPEWVNLGVALDDSDSLAQLWSQPEINGHLFGLSQTGDEAAEVAPSGEAARTWEAASGQKGLPSPEVALDYEYLMALFDQLQAAGPDLTIRSLAAGTRRLPVLGGAHPMAGTWDWQSLHTAIVDSRQIYWDGTRTSQANAKQGTYVQIYGGQRFQAGQFPSGEPPYYPGP